MPELLTCCTVSSLLKKLNSKEIEMPNFMIYENSHPVYLNIIGILNLRRPFDIIL